MGLAELLAAKKAAVPGSPGAPALGTPPALPNLAIPQSPAATSRMRAALQNLSKAKTGTQRNKLPLGTGWFLLKHGAFKKSERKGCELSAFSMYCIKGVVDGNGLNTSAPSYSGPKSGELYEVALFQEGDYKDSNNLQAVAACMGWTKEYIEQLQKYLATGPADTDPTVIEINAIFGQTLGVDLNGVQSGAPCMFSNQIVLELHTKATTKNQIIKGSNPPEPVRNGQGVIQTTTYINTYWQKRISLTTVAAEVPDEVTIKAFGSEAAFVAAVQAEEALNRPA